jgi:hypothetical protein
MFTCSNVIVKTRETQEVPYNTVCYYCTTRSTLLVLFRLYHLGFNLSTLDGIKWRATVHLVLDSNCDSFEYGFVLVKAMSKCFRQAL